MRRPANGPCAPLHPSLPASSPERALHGRSVTVLDWPWSSGICRRVRNSRRMRASFARRQEWRRLRKAASRGAGAEVAILAGVLAASANQAVLAILLVLVAGVLTLASRHALGLARRSRVGVESEMQVRRALQALARATAGTSDTRST